MLKGTLSGIHLCWKSIISTKTLETSTHPHLLRPFVPLSDVLSASLLAMPQTEIDNADDRQETLAFHRTSKEFGEFMDKLLLEIGEYRKGEQDEPALVAADA